MLKRFVLLWTAVACATAVLLCFKLFTVRAQEPSQPVWQNPGKRIDAKAAVLNSNDEASVRAVADEIFNYPHAFGRMPSDIESSIKVGLVRAEIAYRQGRRPGVREEDVVRLVNQVGDALGLPSYARTTKKQVRTIRMSLMLESPVFMAKGAVRPDMHVGDSISPEMSVLQAAHLAQVVLDQKFINPDFQATPEDWDLHFHEQAVERIRQAEELRKMSATNKTSHRIFARINPKRAEMDQAFFSGVSSLGSGGALSLLDSAMKTFRIDQ